MKAVILTGRFGMGHYKAAQAVKERLAEAYGNIQVEIIDWMEYIYPRSSKAVYKVYTWIADYCKWGYNLRYEKLEDGGTNQKPEAFLAGRRGMKRLMREKKPDVIVAVLALCAKTVSSYKEKYGCPVPLITCVTDITAHSEWINDNTDAYMVGAETVKEQFMKKGVAEEKIFVTGIPVTEAFMTGNITGREGNERKLLFMGGGLGLLPRKLSFYEELDKIADTEITVITGKNQRLKQKLEGRFSHIQVLGYVENVADYLKEADLVVTKPGGVTLFEAIAVQTPIAAMNPKMRQECHNADFIEKNQLGCVISGRAEECIEKLEEFLKDTDRIRGCRIHMRDLEKSFDSHGIGGIVDCAVGQEERYYAKKHGKLREAVGFNL